MNARVPAPQLVIEAPESVGVTLYAAVSAGDDALAQALAEALYAAATAAVKYLAEHLTVTNVNLHDEADADPDWPRPHVHITVADRVDMRSYESHAALAHSRYQSAFKRSLLDAGIGVTSGYPSPCGWEITGVIPTIRREPTPRLRCPSHTHAVWALEVVNPAERVRQVG